MCFGVTALSKIKILPQYCKKLLRQYCRNILPEGLYFAKGGLKILGRVGPHIFYPHAFFKKRRGYCNRLRPSLHPSVRLSVTLSPPKPLDEIQPNLVCELLT